MAATYIADHLRTWGVKPGGDQGSYLQAVKILGVHATNRSTLTVEVNGQTRASRTARASTFPRTSAARGP